MIYRVLFAPSVLEHIRLHVAYLRSEGASEEVIVRWYQGLFETIERLQAFPRSCPVDDTECKRTGGEIRRLIYRRYHVHYRVSDAKHLVEILSFVHAARRREL